jgi:hypothetical protein
LKHLRLPLISARVNLYSQRKTILSIQQYSSDAGSACLDTNSIEYRLSSAHGKQEIIFIPWVCGKRKNCQGFLSTLKCPARKRKDPGNGVAGKIVWVIGHRIDDRFKVQPHTKNMTGSNGSDPEITVYQNTCSINLVTRSMSVNDRAAR